MRDAALIIHFIGLAMGLGTSFAFFFLGRQAAKLDSQEAGKFMLNAMTLTKMGNIGLILLFLSGGYLLTPFFDGIGTNYTLIAKLVLFVVLGGLLGVIGSTGKKARAAEDPKPYMMKIVGIGRITMLVTLTIVILAVLTFH